MALKWIWGIGCLCLLMMAGCAGSNNAGEDAGKAAQEPAVAESVGASVQEDVPKVDAVEAASITTNGGHVIPLSALAHQKADAESVVYFVPEISAEALVKAYRAMGWTPTGKVGVKMSTGESEKSNHLRPALIKDLVQSIGGTIVECNTAYGGNRATTEKHLKVIEERGFREVADVDILDAEGSISLPVDGKNLKEDFVGAHFKDYGSFLVLSHFKGHAMGGFGGAIKNISIGFGSSEGKLWIHSAGRSKTEWLSDKQDEFLESMAEAGKAVSDAMDHGKNIAYVSVMNRLSVDCDCDGNPAEPDMHDIGILASTDALAIDQAGIDIVYASPDKDSLVARIERQNGLHTLEHAEKMGLGHREYKLVVVK